VPFESLATVVFILGKRNTDAIRETGRSRGFPWVDNLNAQARNSRGNGEIVLQCSGGNQPINHRWLDAFLLRSRGKHRPTVANSPGHGKHIRGIERFEQFGLRPLFQLVAPFARSQKLNAAPNLREG
jgi:hypothetical protein